WTRHRKVEARPRGTATSPVLRFSLWADRGLGQMAQPRSLAASISACGSERHKWAISTMRSEGGETATVPVEQTARGLSHRGYAITAATTGTEGAVAGSVCGSPGPRPGVRGWASAGRAEGGRPPVLTTRSPASHIRLDERKGPRTGAS